MLSRGDILTSKVDPGAVRTKDERETWDKNHAKLKVNGRLRDKVVLLRAAIETSLIARRKWSNQYEMCWMRSVW